ncbi:hypothetical protein GRZ55_10955 [Chelativorans sp. ZYF759]|uniref:hypothetical protein n=1 Tax=Chelativorans sp. ZYF759 TaxID=2692213 RepID=UPI00145F1A15|nr:hypothetical protein [Chelativorans sp. ZYF759]NMG39761.1 hypothetical protein [Chelativorans sp. ZYF759]
MSEKLSHLLSSVARLIEARSGSIGKYALEERLELWVSAHDSGIDVLYLDPTSGEPLAEKTYVHGKRALLAIRSKLARLGIFTEEACVVEDDVSDSRHCEGSNDNRRQVVADRAPVESRWRKVPVAFVQQTSRSRAGCEVVGEVGELPEGGFEAKVTFEGRTRTWEFDTEWEAKNFVLVMLDHLLEWASAA